MSRQQRLGLIAAAVAVAVVAFVVARPGDDEDDEPAPAATQAQPPETRAQPAPEPEPEPEPAPEVTRIEVRGGEPVGGVTEIEARKGDTLRLTVSSDTPQHIHLHGYDVIKDAAPGAPARFRFRADLEGIFEIELEGPGVQIAELRVEP